MGGTSPWRAAACSVGLYALAGVGFAAVLWVNTGEVLAGVAVGLVTTGLLATAEFQAAARLSWRLSEFAGQVPGEPESQVSVWGDQSLHWPALGLTVQGGTHRFLITGLVAEAEGRTWDVQFSRPRESARRVLADLGREPAFEGFDDRFPSVYPRLSGLKAGAVATLLGVLAVAIGGPAVAGGTYPAWWLASPLAAGVLVGGLRWAGLRSARAAVRAVCQGLRQGGIRVGSVDRIEGLVRLQFVVHTPEGTGVLRCDAVPGGRLAVSHGDDERSGSTEEAAAMGRGLARWLAASPGPAEARSTAPPAPGDLTAAQRLLFASLGAGFLAICALALGGTAPW
jgi:hypothetical protein